MSSPGDRHRKGPGGPSRPKRSGGSGRVTPAGPRRRHRPETSGLIDPTLDKMVATLLETARNAIPPEHPAPGVVLEQWARDLAATSFDDEAMPRDFYVDLGRVLAAATDPLAPAVLAALAVAVRHRDAAPLRRAATDAAASTGTGAGAGSGSSDLGIGRETPTRAITIGHPDEAQVSIVIGFDAAGSGHAVGMMVDDDLDGIGRDLFLGPALEVIEADATADPELVVTEIPLDEAATRMRAALARSEVEGWDDPDDVAVLPLVSRRVERLPR